MSVAEKSGNRLPASNRVLRAKESEVPLPWAFASSYCAKSDAPSGICPAGTAYCKAASGSGSESSKPTADAPEGVVSKCILVILSVATGISWKKRPSMTMIFRGREAGWACTEATDKKNAQTTRKKRTGVMAAGYDD